MLRSSPAHVSHRAYALVQEIIFGRNKRDVSGHRLQRYRERPSLASVIFVKICRSDRRGRASAYRGRVESVVVARIAHEPSRSAKGRASGGKRAATGTRAIQTAAVLSAMEYALGL